MPGFERSRPLVLYFVNPLPSQRRYYPPRRPRFFNPNLLKELIVTASPLAWRRNGNDWVLFDGRRRFGRVVPDQKYPGMWRSVKSRGRLSDLSNLSWAKNAVLVAAERELEWGARDIAAIDPRKCP